MSYPTFAITPFPVKARPLPLRREARFGIICHSTGDDDAVARVIRARAIRHGLGAAGMAYGQLYATGELHDDDGHLVCSVDVGPHGVGGWLGEYIVIAGEGDRVAHAGLRSEQRDQYLSGQWRTMWRKYDAPGVEVAADREVVARWLAKWGALYPSPQDLFPGPSPNACYLGVEFPPVIDGVPGLEPLAPGLRYTRAQHNLMARLAIDVGAREGWLGQLLRDVRKGQPSVRLLGHEDVNPMDRPGWDPGALRLSPWWDWAYVYQRVIALVAVNA